MPVCGSEYCLVVADEADAGPRRGRPPDPDNRRAVLCATRELLAESGYAALTMDGVAKRADLYRRYLYRTWDSKLALVVEALFGDLPTVRAPDTGSAREDVRALVRHLAQITCRTENLNGLSSVVVELQSDAQESTQVLERYVYPTIDVLETILERGRERGELVGEVKGSVVMMATIGMIQLLAQTGVLDSEADIVDTVTGLLFDGIIE